MITFQEINKLAKALPNSYITKPYKKGYNTDENLPDVCSWIKDSEGETIGFINWELGIIEIFENYEFRDEVIDSIGRESFNATNTSAYERLAEKLYG